MELERSWRELETVNTKHIGTGRALSLIDYTIR